MAGIGTDVLAGLQALSLPEAVAVVLAVFYLLLAIRQNIWCWPCAAVSTGIYIGLFVDARLYMEALLNAFYLAMALYGWWQWTGGGARDKHLPVVRWARHVHALAIAVIVLLALVSGTLLERYSDAAFPYLDSLTTWGAIWATFLVARKVLENWWYWLVIDTASIVIYWLRDLPLTAVLFVVYVILIPVGLVSWTRSWRSQATV